MDPLEPLYTYQFLMGHFEVAYSTIYRWFRKRRRFCFRNSVRVPHSEVLKFIHDYETKTGQRFRAPATGGRSSSESRPHRPIASP
jgi:hypothetical protein